jgi:uncharacterized membrane protein YvlD (DUF360 family)
LLRFVVRIVITAGVFAFILPLIPGIDFHGNFGFAIIAALLFGILGWLVDIAAVTLSALFTISTLGFALLIIIPLWFLSFWILPAITLHLLADAMPNHLTVHGWGAAMLGGLVMFVVGALTSCRKKK